MTRPLSEPALGKREKPGALSSREKPARVGFGLNTCSLTEPRNTSLTDLAASTPKTLPLPASTLQTTLPYELSANEWRSKSNQYMAILPTRNVSEYRKTRPCEP